MLEKTYQPAEVERRIYQQWEDQKCFVSGRADREAADAYSIVIPPPNVTGSLHMGHALNNTLQDILCRFERMRGKDVLWQPGTDHAGIATQMVVERQLAESGEPDRREMGRDAFVKRVWAWKEESGGTIINQLKRLGASCDWDRERFTMDEGLSEAVLKVFVELYEQGLIYKDKRLVNWDPHFLTAISDLEVQQVESNGHLWHFKYPVEGEDGRFLTVATTRPETMLGDTAVAVHPDDDRYKDLIGKHVRLPIVDRLIPVVADEHADPETGSGAVKITPAHDFNDFEVGKRHALAMLNVFDQHAAIVADGDADAAQIPEAFRGLDRFEARKAVVDWFEEQGLLEKIDDHQLQLPYGDRSNVIIEPWLTDQWYVDAETLAKPAIAAVENGDTSFVPKNWEKTYYQWMHNIQPWCISRQLWWGHQIPAWYDDDGNVFVALTEGDAAAKAKAHHGKDVSLTRDPDVLDTWFSSALWPFSTLGWPSEDKALQRYYPTNTLVTGFDIIFFWVARMMMFGMHFMKEIPFHDVYIHALVRDENGAKMSKSKGNVIDPLDLIDAYGADALRFTLSAMAAPGRDIKLATSRVEGYRNFATKLWNASRFAEMNECVHNPDFDPSSVRLTVNRWIVGETERARDAVTKGIESYRFDEAASAVYQFAWGVFCDWYVELSKATLNGNDDAAKLETRETTAWALDQILKLLHPFMPFVTEELWARMAEHGTARQSLLVLSEWPSYSGLLDEKADRDINWLIDAVTAIRSVRSQMNVPESAKISALILKASDETISCADANEDILKRLARLDNLMQADDAPKGSVQVVVGDATLALPLGDVIDVDAEIKRLKTQITKTNGDILGIDKKLGNEQFMSKAPEAVVAEQRTRREAAELRKLQLEEALKRLEEMV